MLQSIDTHWREHLAALDYLRQGIHLRGYAQKQPKQEYKREAFELFGAMLDSIKREVTRHLIAVQVRSRSSRSAKPSAAAEEAARALKNVQYQHATSAPRRSRRSARGRQPRAEVAAHAEASRARDIVARRAPGYEAFWQCERLAGPRAHRARGQRRDAGTSASPVRAMR